MERIFQEAVAGLSPQEKAVLRQLGSTVEKGAIEAMKRGVNDQLDRLLKVEPGRHIRLVKP